MTYQPMHSAQAQSVRVTEKYILGLYCLDITRNEDKCIFYRYYRVKPYVLSYSSMYS